MRPIVFALFLASTISCPSNAAIFGIDDREYVSTAPGSPYSPIGLVKGFGAYTTGTLINRCDVLTVEHPAEKWRDPTGERVTFFGAIGSGHQRWSDGTIIAAGGISLKRSDRRNIQSTGSDWMIARLDDCLGDKLGWARLGTSEAWPTENDPRHLQEAGFPMDRDRKLGLSLDPACAIRGVADRMLFHDCATMPGNSGGPIFRLVTIDGVQRMEIVGMVTAAQNWSHAKEPVQGTENIALAAFNIR